MSDERPTFQHLAQSARRIAVSRRILAKTEAMVRKQASPASEDPPVPDTRDAREADTD